jgi:hypothetical protein
LLVDTAFNQGDGPALMSNKIAFATAIAARSGVPLQLPTDSALTSAQASYISNYLMNVPGRASAETLASIEAIARNEESAGSSEALLLAIALSSYSSGDIQKAFLLLEELAITSSNKGKYNHILGLFCLDQDEPVRALGYIDFALSQQYSPSVLAKAVALTESLRFGPIDRTAGIQQATQAWDSVARYQDSTVSNLAMRANRILKASPADVMSMGEEDRYAFARYRVLPWDTVTLIRILTSIQEPNLTARGMLEASRLLLNYDELNGATSMLDKAKAVPVTDPMLHEELRLHERILMTARGDLAGLQRVSEAPLRANRSSAILKTHSDALLTASAGDTALASKNFRDVVQRTFFYDQGILDAASYFRAKGTDQLQAYNLLVEATQHHPSSVRLRKAYVREAMRVGFSDFAEHALAEMRPLLPAKEFEKFAAEVRTNQ